MNVLITIKDLFKIYKNKKHEVRALDGVSLEVYEGEILGLLGVNGAGKTTLSSILATLHPATSGSVQFMGKSIYDDLISYRYALGFCSQHPNLDGDLTVRENLEFAGRYYLLDEGQTKERAQELLKEFNLLKYENFNVSELSGGYKQRLMIARAMVHQPKLVILDEPTVALDPGIRRQLWEIIKRLKRSGVTVILTTHYLEEAEVLSDRVCILHHGKIMLIEKPENLKRQFEKANLEEVFLHLTKEEDVE